MYNSVITYQLVSILGEGNSPTPKDEGFFSSSFMKEWQEKVTNFMEVYSLLERVYEQQQNQQERRWGTAECFM